MGEEQSYLTYTFEQMTLCMWTVRTGVRSMCLMNPGESTMGQKHRLVSGPGIMGR